MSLRTFPTRPGRRALLAAALTAGAVSLSSTSAMAQSSDPVVQVGPSTCVPASVVPVGYQAAGGIVLSPPNGCTPAMFSPVWPASIPGVSPPGGSPIPVPPSYVPPSYVPPVYVPPVYVPPTIPTGPTGTVPTVPTRPTRPVKIPPVKVVPGSMDIAIPSIGLPSIPLPKVPLPAGVPQPKISAWTHTKTLLAHTSDGQIPNGVATDPVISGDGRIAAWIAYTSDATNIVAGSGSVKNVYLVQRVDPHSDKAPPWKEKQTLLASKGIGGPANGDSWGGAFDGFRGGTKTYGPTCFAFLSKASNLVAGDSDGAANVFVRNLKTGKLTRIASSKGATEVSINGLCTRLTYATPAGAYLTTPDGKLKPVKVAGPGASTIDMAATENTSTVTYALKGAVYAWHADVKNRGKSKKVAAGTDPTGDAWGKLVSYRRGEDVFQASTVGPAHEKRVVDPNHGGKVYTTAALSATAAGHFIMYGIGPYVDSNVYRNFAVCPKDGATVTGVSSSAHGNYAAYTCSTGDSWLSYVGAQRAGDA